MSPVQALTLGVVQGLTEFLPISSSGHLILVSAAMGWPDQGLAFDAAVHLGTGLALLCYFAVEITRVVGRAAGGGAPERRLLTAIVLGTVPAAVAGLLFEATIEGRLRTAAVVGGSQILGAGVLWWADRQAERATVARVSEVSIWRGVLIGGAQVLALVPGASRSGVTLSAGLLAGLDRPTAARFAFLLGLPLTTGAGVAKVPALVASAGSLDGLGTAFLGLVAAFVAGLAAVWFMLRYLERRTLVIFVLYRIGLGLLIFALIAAGEPPPVPRH